MSRIIPYDDTLEVGKTVFITPEDKIIITDEKHEIFAQNYCEGNISKLTKGELILYKHWLEQNDYNKRKMCSDFLVDVLGFDKILTNMRKSITTTTLEPHMRFYNYYLMDKDRLEELKSSPAYERLINHIHKEKMRAYQYALSIRNS